MGNHDFGFCAFIGRLCGAVLPARDSDYPTRERGEQPLWTGPGSEVRRPLPGAPPERLHNPSGLFGLCVAGWDV